MGPCEAFHLLPIVGINLFATVARQAYNSSAIWGWEMWIHFNYISKDNQSEKKKIESVNGMYFVKTSISYHLDQHIFLRHFGV
jgi:hypothetical protein